MHLARSSFWTPLFALDRLNSWLRAEQPLCCPFRGPLKPVIYWTKTQAILLASKEWQIGMRRVMVKKPCRKCDGTGSWLPWWADKCDDYCCKTYAEFRVNHGETCRGCSGTGTATLKFVETTIGPLRWHTPAEKWYMSSLDVYVPFPSYYGERTDTHYELAEGWEPNQKGRPLGLAEVERDMAILLAAYTHEVCFSIDFHHHLRLSYRHPDVSKVQAWLRGLFHPTESN